MNKGLGTHECAGVAVWGCSLTRPVYMVQMTPVTTMAMGRVSVVTVTNKHHSLKW